MGLPRILQPSYDTFFHQDGVTDSVDIDKTVL